MGHHHHQGDDQAKVTVPTHLDSNCWNSARDRPFMVAAYRMRSCMGGQWEWGRAFTPSTSAADTHMRIMCP